MATIYRVEDFSKQGPYSTHDFDDWDTPIGRMVADHNGDSFSHPSPFQSMNVIMSSLRGNPKCGFTSMVDLFKWFGGWLTPLKREGFQVTIMDAEILAGPDEVGQIVFNDQREF
jgi:hypothetical protein